jgi:hypothetical protein
VVEENNFTELESLCTVSVVEVESHFLRVAVHLWERNRVPALHVEVQLPVSHLMPPALKQVEGVDVNL